jgi:tRNA (guanine-N7-)-methyltransferase
MLDRPVTAQADGSQLPTPGSGGVFGRRIGRKLRSGRSALMEHLLPRLEIDPAEQISRETLFPGLSEVRLEIGFGGGEHLADHAQRRPQTGFIGCEPFRNGIAKFLEQVEARSLNNVRVHAGDAGVLMDRLPESILAGVDLFYPDPWPKRRQRKRRFVSDEILGRLARAMAKGAALRFATDIDDYAGWTLARVMRSPFFAWPAARADDWRKPWPDWPSTRYEAKALREGRRPVYLTFIRTEARV